MDEKIEIDSASFVLGLNKDRVEIPFRKDRQFLESLKAYVDLMAFGVKMIEAGVLDSKTQMPSFELDPKDTLTGVKRRFTAMTKAAITANDSFQNPSITYIKYKREPNHVTVSGNVNDFANMGRYKIEALVKGYSKIGERYIRLDASDKEFFFRNLSEAYANQTYYYGSAGTNEQTAAAVKNIFNNYEVFLVKLYDSPNLRQGINHQLALDLNTAINPYIFNGYRSQTKLKTCVHTKEDAKGLLKFVDYDSPDTNYVFPKIREKIWDEHLLDKYVIPDLVKTRGPGIVDSKILEKIKNILPRMLHFSAPPTRPAFNHYDTNTIVSLLSNFTQSGRRYYPGEVINQTPYSDTSIYLGASKLNNTILPGLIGTYGYLLAYKHPDPKPWVDITRTDFQMTIDFILNEATMRNPSDFVAAHNAINNKLKELTDGNRF